MKDPMLHHDFSQFQQAGDGINSEAPISIQKSILSHVKNELDPGHARVFSKLLAIHALIGTMTLTLCPQFNMSLTNQYQLFHYFHQTFGKYVCMFICGTIFIGTGALFAAYILNKAEVHLIRKTRWLYYTGISMIAVLSFMLMGAEVYLPLALCWFAGASISGMVIFEMNHQIKKNILLFDC